MKDIVIIGAGGFGRDVAWLIEEINQKQPEWNIVGFVDDNPELMGKMVGKYAVVGDLEWLKAQSLYVVCAIGNPTVKKMLIEKLEGSANQYPVLIHPSAIYSDSVTFGDGCIICAGSIFTVNVCLGKHVSTDIYSNVGHDSRIADFVTLYPKACVAGNVTVGTCVSFGACSSVLQGLSVGPNTMVGSGAVIVRNIEGNCTVAGVPAKVL